MITYSITGLEKANISSDRTRFDIEFRTAEGPVTLAMKAEHLDALITCLQGLEYNASLIDPKTGAKPGEFGQIRAEIVDSYQLGNGAINDIPSIFLGLKVIQIFRWFALDPQKAVDLSKALQEEIDKIQAPPSSH